MSTKAIFHKTREADDIARGAIHFAPLIADSLRQALHCDLEWETTQTRLGEELLEASAALREADEACTRERHHAVDLRVKRDRAVQELYEAVVSLRRIVTATQGESMTLSLLGLAGKTPRVADRLAAKARTMVERLRDPDRELPPARCLGFPLDLQRVAAGLEATLVPVEELLAALEVSRVDLNGLLAQRDRELERFRSVRTGLFRVLEGLYVAAGREDLVPNLRRPGASVQPPVRRRSPARKTTEHRVPEELEREVETAPAVQGEPGVEAVPLRLVVGAASDGEPAEPRSVEQVSIGKTGVSADLGDEETGSGGGRRVRGEEEAVA